MINYYWAVEVYFLFLKVQSAGDTIGQLAGQVGDSVASDHSQAARQAAGVYARSPMQFPPTVL